MSKERETIKKKERILMIGVGFFVLLFAILWIFSLRSTVFSNSNNPQINTENEYWQTLQTEVFSGFEEMNAIWEEAQSNELLAEGEILLDGIKEKIKEEALENNNKVMVEELVLEEEDLKELKILNNCPEFVNCMPSYSGEKNTCIVPPGCEDITLKVY